MPKDQGWPESVSPTHHSFPAPFEDSLLSWRPHVEVRYELADAVGIFSMPLTLRRLPSSILSALVVHRPLGFTSVDQFRMQAADITATVAASHCKPSTLR